MERSKSVAVILLLTVTGLASAVAAKAASTLLQEGLYAEEIDGDLDAAIKIYQQIITAGTAQRSHIAQAMYRQGMCYLKKQDEVRAREVFAKLVADYSDQTRVVEKVRPMLAELSNGDPAALMPPETVIYLEGGSPGKQFEKILKMLEGTPFENPLEAIGSGSGPRSDPSGGRSTGYSGPGPENILAGLLNPSNLAEFKKIRGIGVGVTGVTNDDPPVIVVLYPGKSDALRGMLMMVLTAFGKPGEAIEGMQTIALHDGGGAAYDDSTIIVASPKAYAAGQLSWCVRQHKGLIKEPTLASSNKSFARISKKDRQEHALTIWANVDEVFTGLKRLFPADGVPEQMVRADEFVNFENVDDLIAFLSIEEDRIAVETNIGFKDGRQSTAYNLIRTPSLNKAAFNAVPSEAVALISTGSPEAGSPQSQMLSGKLKEKMGLEIGNDVFANVDQITLFALPAPDEAVPGVPPLALSLGVIVSSDQPQETKQILTRLLTGANMLTSQPTDGENAGRYHMQLANGATVHCYADQASRATVLSLNPAVIDAAVSAVGNRKSVIAAGPLKEAVSTLSPATSKVALINVGGMLDFVETDENMSELIGQLAKSCDKTTVRIRTQEEQNSLKARAEISGLPPVGEVIGPAMQLAKQIQEAKARSREQARMAGIPAAVRPTDRPPIIDGRADNIWSEIHRQKIRNTAYAPAEGREDLTAFYRAMWDQDNLYVLVNVMD
ncbi:MAG: tetratricopeptide repeat protein, partial [Phycisphaerales bacterium]